MKYLWTVVAISRGSSLHELAYMGIFGIMDPPREAARRSVLTLQNTGVKVKMVTGDAQETACAIAQSVGLQVCTFIMYVYYLLLIQSDYVFAYQLMLYNPIQKNC